MLKMAAVARLRLIYSKGGLARFLAHLDTCNVLQRAVRRAELPVAFSEGFSPHPRVSFGPPLPIFVEGEREICDVELVEELPVQQAVERMNRTLPSGFAVVEASVVPLKAPSITAAVRQATYRVAALDGELGVTEARVAQVLSRQEIVIEKESRGARRSVDIRPAILALTVVEAGLEAVLEASPSRTLNVFDLIREVVPGYEPAWLGRLAVVRTGLALAADEASPVAPRPARPRVP
ncbi:MAG: DUF2344 domain-containing protein [Candidatus Riflebacteria bacterium]|nr:DUF2344 domain-containing protein [Candidatus Riflebacteria bacterium]